MSRHDPRPRAAGAWLLAWAPAADEDPFAMFSGWDSGSLALLAVLVVAAVSVFWIGSRRVSRERSGRSLRPQGRVAGDHGGRHFGAAWRAKATRLEGREPTPIDQADVGAIRIVATIIKSAGSLGGPPERACVWRNRAGGRPDSAVGAELIVVADDSGHCGVEGLEGARVTAPSEKVGMHYEWVSLYVGDRVEILGHFEPERVGSASDDPTKVVYGTLGASGPLEVRLVERPEPAEEAAPDDDEPDAPSRPPEES
ncbi:MAG: hypothetical protein AAF721_39215 [Myxococcota bacterium]